MASHKNIEKINALYVKEGKTSSYKLIIICLNR